MKTNTQHPTTLTSRPPGNLLRTIAFISLCALCLSSSASILDDFSGSKAGWTDTANGGTIVQSGGQFTIGTAAADGSLTYSRKTATNFANAVGATLEFRV